MRALSRILGPELCLYRGETRLVDLTLWLLRSGTASLLAIYKTFCHLKSSLWTESSGRGAEEADGMSNCSRYMPGSGDGWTARTLMHCTTPLQAPSYKISRYENERYMIHIIQCTYHTRNYNPCSIYLLSNISNILSLLYPLITVSSSPSLPSLLTFLNLPKSPSKYPEMMFSQSVTALLTVSISLQTPEQNCS